jgi:hypothetical protein
MGLSLRSGETIRTIVSVKRRGKHLFYAKRGKTPRFRLGSTGWEQRPLDNPATLDG